MRFEVPQFIDVEDKIFGPLTFKQFIYLVGGGSLAYVMYRVVPFPFWPILALLFVGLAAALAFYKINNRPFIEIAQSWITYAWKGKLYIWKRAPVQPKPIIVPVPEPPKTSPQKTITAERIADLAKNLDILDNT